MPLSHEEFEAQCKAICPMCARGSRPTRRASTGEWQHNQSEKRGPGGSVMTINLCHANDLRQGRGKTNG